MLLLVCLSLWAAVLLTNPAGTRSVYIPSTGTNLLLATRWLLIINDEIDDYDQDSADHNVPISLGCISATLVQIPHAAGG